jgi:TolB-like protein/DNA-binding winged helix-turn-helix (wHTH) protein/Flp pilus assembly protein TadD
MATVPQATSSVLRFDVFELDIRALELRKRGAKVRLQGQPLLVLAALLEHSGKLVTREELRAQIWPADTFVDFDHSLHNAIARIREALGDSSEKPRYIETLPRRGYRFIAPVERVVVPEKQPLRQVEQVPELVMRRPQARSRPLWAFVVSGVVILAALIGLLLVASHRTSAASSVHSIAVLPLENLSGDSSQDYFADAMTDELITDLAKVGGLRVTSRTTVTLYKHTNKTLPEIARELNVDAIVEGSIMRSGQRVRVTAQLIHAPADQHVWAETYERDSGDALRLQSDVAQAITQQVRAQLTPQLKEQFNGTKPVDPDAYDAYLKGRYYIYNESYIDPVSLNQAKANFEEAIRKDPNFSPAYSGLAETYICLALFTKEITGADGYRFARDAVQRALELDPNNGEAYDALGELNWYADLDLRAAERSFNTAIALAPSFSCAREDRAMLWALMGRRDEALKELQISKQIDPGPISVGVESAVYLQLRDWEHLREWSRVRLGSNPNDRNVHADLGTAYEGMGKLPEAIAEYQKASELSNGDPRAVAALGHAYAVIGNRTEAERILRNIEEKSSSGKASPYLAATIYAGLGQKDKAMELMEKAYSEKSLDLAWAVQFDVSTDNLRSDPRFQNLLNRVGLTN